MKNYLDLRNKMDCKLLKEPAEIIRSGGIVIFPTETVYGIGANGLDEKAVDKLYKVKNRPLNKPISLLVSNMEMIEKITKNISNKEYKLMNKFFPGPFTIILKKKNIIPDIVTSGGDTVGIRMPSGEIARKLVEYANVPIATPSANISGKPSGTNIDSIIRDFEGKVDYIIDGGESKIGIASTIVQVVNEEIHILREGIISRENVLNI